MFTAMNANMVLCLIFILLFYIKFSFSDPKFSVSARWMKCKDSEPSVTEEDYGTFEIKSEDGNVYSHNFDLIGPELVNTCQRKIYIYIRINQNGTVSGDDDYVVIDEVTDESTDVWAKLLHPIIVKFHREQPQLVYPLQFEKVVNGGVSEDVIYVESQRGKRCDTSVCGYAFRDNSTAAALSEGFCCSCERSIYTEFNGLEKNLDSSVPRRKSGRVKRSVEPEVKLKLQNSEEEKELKGAVFLRKKVKLLPPSLFFENDKRIMETKEQENDDDEGLNATHLEGKVKIEFTKEDGEEDNPGHKHSKEMSHHHHVERASSKQGLQNKSSKTDFGGHPKGRTLPNLNKRSIDSLFDHGGGAPLQMRVDRERLGKVLASRAQNDTRKKVRRNCDDSSVESDTVHCLKYSDLFYSVYVLKDPNIVQEMSVQVFEQRTGDDASTYWVDLTRGKVIRLGSLFPQAKDKLPTIAMTYSSSLENIKDDPSIYPINPNAVVVLVPSHLHGDGSIATHPEAQGGPSEYLIVSKDELSRNGNECDKIGTSFNGFSLQPDRCDQPMGSCLTRQPIDLWIEDMDLKLKNKRGAYFLENYGSLPATELTSLKNVQNDFIAFEFSGELECAIEIELQSDMNGLIKKGSNIELQSIITDASLSQFMKIEIIAINQGLVPGHFHPRIVDCDPSFSATPLDDGPKVLISPLRRNLFRLWVEEELPEASVTCTVDIHNAEGWRVASRQMMIQKNKRCLCAFHCSCQCISSGEKTQPCTPLMQEEYEAAGYSGSIPYQPLLMTNVSFKVDRFNIIFMALTLLLLFGKIKMLLGCREKWVHDFGLTFIRGREECSCADSLKLRIIDVFINTFFFIMYPLKIIWKCLLYILKCKCCRCRNKDDEENETTPLSSTYSWGSNLESPPFVGYIKTMQSVDKLHYDDNDPLEEEDTEYVLMGMEEN